MPVQDASRRPAGGGSRIRGVPHTIANAPCTSLSARPTPFPPSAAVTSSRPRERHSRRRRTNDSGYCTTASSATTCTSSSRAMGHASCAAASRASPSGLRRRSTVRSAAGARSGRIDTTRGRSRRHARSVTRSSTSFRTGGSISPVYAASTRGRLQPGSRGGEHRSSLLLEGRRSRAHGRGSRASGGGGVGWSASTRGHVDDGRDAFRSTRFLQHWPWGRCRSGGRGNYPPSPPTVTPRSRSNPSRRS